MSHYECSECGVFRCPGGCQTPEKIARRKEMERQSKISAAKKILNVELSRHNDVVNACKLLITENEWDDRYDCLFEG